MTSAAIATAVSAAACLALVQAEYAGDAGKTGRMVAKPIASAAFVAVPFLGGALAGGGFDLGAAPAWIVIGLVLGAIGDVLLLFPRAFLAGLVVFLLGHVAYVIAFSRIVPMAEWPRAAKWPALGAVAIGATALAWLWPHLGKLRIPVIAYVLVIVLMVIGAVAVGARLAPATAAWLVVIGAVLFFASDLAVARDRFVAAGFVNRAWGLPAYYAGQLLIAWSITVDA